MVITITYGKLSFFYFALISDEKGKLNIQILCFYVVPEN